MEPIYHIAGMNIGLELLSEELYPRFEEYRTEGNADFTIRLFPEDIEKEREMFERVDQWMGRTDVNRRGLLLEFTAVHRKIAEQAPYHHVFSFHGSAISVDGEAYIFSALPGTGKSTHVRLWREMLGERAVMVNDDKPMLRITKEETIVCGTPWNGKHKIGNNIEVPLKAICFLEQSAENWIHEISKKEAYPELIRQIFRPEDPLAMAKIIELVDLMKVRYYRLGCNMDPEAAAVAYQGMRA